MFFPIYPPVELAGLGNIVQSEFSIEIHIVSLTAEYLKICCFSDPIPLHFVPFRENTKAPTGLVRESAHPLQLIPPKNRLSMPTQGDIGPAAPGFSAVQQLCFTA